MTQLLRHRRPQLTQQCPQPPPHVEDTIFPGQPKHAPSSLRGKGRLGGCSEAGEVRGEPGRAGLEKHSGNVREQEWSSQWEGTGLWLQVRGDLLGAVKCWRYTLQGPSPLAAHSVSATLTVQEKRPTKPQASFCDFLWKWPLPPRLLSPLRIHKTTIEP